MADKNNDEKLAYRHVILKELLQEIAAMEFECTGGDLGQAVPYLKLVQFSSDWARELDRAAVIRGY